MTDQGRNLAYLLISVVIITILIISLDLLDRNGRLNSYYQILEEATLSEDEYTKVLGIINDNVSVIDLYRSHSAFNVSFESEGLLFSISNNPRLNEISVEIDGHDFFEPEGRDYFTDLYEIPVNEIMIKELSDIRGKL